MGYRRELAYRLGNVKYAEGGQELRPDLVPLPLNGLQAMGGRSVSVGSRGILVIPKRNFKTEQ